jgi:predicted double-glycine peptidase
MSGASDFYVPVKSVLDRRYDGVIRQKFDFSCGSAALAGLLRYQYGEPIDETAAFRGMWAAGDREQIRRLGFSLLDMKRFLAQRGLRANGYAVGLEKVAEGATPGIALINVKGYKHFVVVKGVSPTEVLVGDPSTGLQTMTRAQFMKQWNGVYFVIDPRDRKGRFNVGAQWATYTRAPVGSRFADPLSTQALALNAPFYRDF